MNCREYTDEYLAAYVDGELSLRDRRAADEHVGGCSRCRARLGDERALKALIRQHAGIVKTPADLRLRLRAALSEIGDSQLRVRRTAMTRASTPWSPPDSRREGRVERIIRAAKSPPTVWVSVAVAASLILSLAFFGIHKARFANTAPGLEVPDFDRAIAKFNNFAGYFSPNVPVEAFNSRDGTVYAWVESPSSIHGVSDEEADIARSYEQVNLPGDLFNFASSGYELYGGRVERLADGRPVSYTLYRNGDSALLSMAYDATGIALPPNARLWLGMHAFYEYKGYGVCMTVYPTGHFISIAVTRAPVTDLIRTVALADIAATEQ